MPQQLYWVREKESGRVFQMHSVDATEGMAFGDYEMVPDPTKDVSPEERLAAAAGMRSVAPWPHPELQTPEQKAEVRRMAKEQTEAKARGEEVLPGAPPAPPPPPSPPPSEPAAATSRSTSGTSSGSRSGARE
jgi:hypothetical protein